MLEDCDKFFMRKLFEAEQGTPIESFFLETSAWPIRYIIIGRKLMYYRKMLRKSEKELVKKVFNAQSAFPTKGDWVTGIKDILKEYDISFSEQEIGKMSMTKFKSIVKGKIQLKVMSHLIALQNKHTKSEQLHFEGKMQEYLTASNLTLSDKKFLFILRSKMLRIKGNFSSIYKGNMTCSLCLDKQFEGNENHLLACPEIIKLLGKETENVQYENVFKDLAKQKKAVNIFRQIMNIYEKNRKNG
jgi:hypothetical protein